MFGFFSCADADGADASPNAARKVAITTTAVPMRFI
jgi:hypothetical protein